MPYIQTADRNQMMFCSWDSFVAPDSNARLIDAFVDSLDMRQIGVKDVAKEGRPSYNPRSLFKLYIYGSKNGIRSSRKLAESCRLNIEVKWLMEGVEPDFRTISDFRKDNIKSLKAIFHEFNRRISGSVEWGFTSIDGSKIHANNSKDNNFTKNKLDDRIKWLNQHTDEYLRILQDMDEEEDFLDNPDLLTRDMVTKKLEEARERLTRYEGYQKRMEAEGLTQLSLIDKDSKLMKNKNGFEVSYNPQTAVDSNTHLIRNFQMTNQPTDHGLLASTLEEVKAEEKDAVIETVADKGYEDAKDMVDCLEKGIIPHVITDDGKDGYELEISYEANSEADKDSTKVADLSKCIHAGIVPKAYEDVIAEIEVKEVNRFIRDEKTSDTIGSRYGSFEDMTERAKEGYFVRDPERNLVICPAGEVLRQKSIKKNGNIRYANKNACKHCKNRNKCYKGKNEWKEIEFTKDRLEKPCKDWLASEGNPNDLPSRKRKGHYEKVKVVRLFLKPDRNKTAKRMCLSEHPFGTMKRTMGFTYFLLRGMEKVEGEFALSCLGYNIERAKNLLGFEKMMELMTV